MTISLQAFVNLVLTLCDAGDSVVMFAPYYFNAYMSFQMTGVTNILVGPGDPKTLHPDAGEKLGLSSSIFVQTSQFKLRVITFLLCLGHLSQLC